MWRCWTTDNTDALALKTIYNMKQLSSLIHSKSIEAAPPAVMLLFNSRSPAETYKAHLSPSYKHIILLNSEIASVHTLKV